MSTSAPRVNASERLPGAFAGWVNPYRVRYAAVVMATVAAATRSTRRLKKQPNRPSTRPTSANAIHTNNEFMAPQTRPTRLRHRAAPPWVQGRRVTQPPSGSMLPPAATLPDTSMPTANSIEHAYIQNRVAGGYAAVPCQINRPGGRALTCAGLFDWQT